MPSPETIALLLSLALGFCFTAGFQIGRVSADRKHRRENAATASCVACEWTSGPVPLAAAFRAANGHLGGETHRTIVERAQ